MELNRSPIDGYKLHFRFSENDWIEDEVLTKEVTLSTDSSSDKQICHTSGSAPKWKKEV